MDGARVLVASFGAVAGIANDAVCLFQAGSLGRESGALAGDTIVVTGACLVPTRAPALNTKISKDVDALARDVLVLKVFDPAKAVSGVVAHRERA